MLTFSPGDSVRNLALPGRMAWETLIVESSNEFVTTVKSEERTNWGAAYPTGDLVIVPRALTEDDCNSILSHLRNSNCPKQLVANLNEHFASNCMIEG